MAIDGEGNIWVAWREERIDFHPDDPVIFHVSRWNGESWEDMSGDPTAEGGVSTPSRPAMYPNLAVGPDGSVWFYWVEFDRDPYTGMSTELRRWTGEIWETIESPTHVEGRVEPFIFRGIPSMAFDQHGNPIVAWIEHSDDQNTVFARRWMDDGWVEVAQDSPSLSELTVESVNMYNCKVAVNHRGEILVVWQTHTINHPVPITGICARLWDGSEWIELGESSSRGSGITNGAGESRGPSVCFNTDGNPIVAWMNAIDQINRTHSEIHCRRWIGEEWTEMGDGSASGGGVSGPNHHRWRISEDEHQTPLDQEAESARIGVNQNGDIFLVWNEMHGMHGESWFIVILQWNGQAWIPMGEESSIYPIISDPSTVSAGPRLAFDPNGNPIVSWGVHRDGQVNIHLRRWVPDEE